MAFQPTSRRPPVPSVPAPVRLVLLSTKVPPRRSSEPWTPCSCAAPQNFCAGIVPAVVSQLVRPDDSSSLEATAALEAPLSGTP